MTVSISLVLTLCKFANYLSLADERVSLNKKNSFPTAAAPEVARL